MAMDWVSGSAIFAAGAAGALSLGKLWKIMKAKRETGAASNKLFPNGERLEIIRAIKELKDENEARRDEIRGQRRVLDKIAAHLKIDVLE